MEIQKILNDMQAHGMTIPSNKVQIKIEGARDILKNHLDRFINLEGKKAVWLDKYDLVADWLENNQGRGLFLYGTCGVGKTVLARYVIPSILLTHLGKVVHCYDAQQMNSQIDIVLSKKIICIDDVGTEEILVSFGNKRLTFLEVADATEKQGKLLIATSNLNGKQLIDKYGERTMERIISTTKRVLFTDKSLRR